MGRLVTLKKDKPTISVGDTVKRVSSDYTFIGTVVAKFNKLSGLVRYVVEDDRGVLFIWNEKNMELVPRPT